MVDFSNHESSYEVNSLSVEDGARVGKWLSEMDIEPDKAVLWPHTENIARAMIEESDVSSVTGLSPVSLSSQHPDISTARILSHDYTGNGFDFEYGWALGDDLTAAIRPQIKPENNLYQFEYEDVEQCDLALENAMKRIVNTSDRLLDSEGAMVLYTMSGVNRYQMPDLDDDSLRNQFEYAERMADQLEERGFEPQIHYDPEESRHVYLSGQR